MAAANEAKKHTDILTKAKIQNSNPEFLFASGLYNYYRVQYPESHPLVKPVIMFLITEIKLLGLPNLKTLLETLYSVEMKLLCIWQILTLNTKLTSKIINLFYYS